MVIPNFRGAGVLNKCLSSLHDQTIQGFQVIIVHNDPSEDLYAYLDPRYHACTRIIVSNQALGFAKAVNCGLSVVNTEFVMLLNNDAALDTMCLERLLSLTHEYPDFAAFQPLILGHDGVTIHSAGDELTIFGWAYQFLSKARVQRAGITPRECFSVCGAAAVYRMDALHQVGFLDEKLWSYYEDVELGLRLRVRGWKALVVPSAICQHIGGWAHSEAVSTKELSELRARNELYLYQEIRQLVGAWSIVTDVLNVLFMAIMRSCHKQVRSQQRSIHFGVRNSLVKRNSTIVRTAMVKSTFNIFIHFIGKLH